jgi:hypothetical protein
MPASSIALAASSTIPIAISWIALASSNSNIAY